jgi:RNA recognition motif-containing protein
VQEDAAATKAEETEATANAQETAAENEQEISEDAENAGQDKSEKKKPRQGKGNGKPFRFNRNNRTVYHQPENSDPSCRVYVGNLAWEVTWMDLKDHMKQGGCEVTRADILATPDGRSKGCGIVEFASAEGAQRALLLNDTELKGRQIFVREDRESAGGGGYFAQKPSAGVSKGRVSGGEKQSCRVYVGNLSWEVAWQDLKDHMRGAGEVVYAEVMTEPDGRSKGCGIVEYSTPEEAKKACETLNDTELQGRMIFVREDRETAAGSGGAGAGRQRGGYRGGTSVYVGNLAYETSWQDLKDHMRQAGNVDQVCIRFCAWVCMFVCVCVCLQGSFFSQYKAWFLFFILHSLHRPTL